MVLAKPFGGYCLIVVGETFYQLVNKDLCLQFCDVFTFHLSPYQFGVIVKKGYEIMIHGIRATLDARPNWVMFEVDIINAFNAISCKLI